MNLLIVFAGTVSYGLVIAGDRKSERSGEIAELRACIGEGVFCWGADRWRKAKEGTQEGMDGMRNEKGTTMNKLPQNSSNNNYLKCCVFVVVAIKHNSRRR